MTLVGFREALVGTGPYHAYKNIFEPLPLSELGLPSLIQWVLEMRNRTYPTTLT